MQIISQIIPSSPFFPNNPKLPFLIYKKALSENAPGAIEKLFHKNGWIRSWVNGMYPFHHFHSNTHEVLGIASGTCKTQIGGNLGPFFDIEKGDVLILPAETSHKNIKSSDDFVSIGAYPIDIQYDMLKGDKEDSEILKRILEVPLPKSDPVFGENGPLFGFWIK